MKKLVTIVAILTKISFIEAQTLTSSNLPIVIIDTQGQTIVDEPKTTVKLKIIYNGAGKRNQVTDVPNVYDGLAGIEFRGSSSQLFPKKPYGFELRDAQGEGREVALLGMPKEEDWILFASYNEKSLLHNALAMKMARDLGMYASRTQHLEVVINGKYEGIYMLMEKIKRVSGRVNLTKMSDKDNSGDVLTGGYIFKIDKSTGSGGREGWVSKIPAPFGTSRIQYLYDYPAFDDITTQQKSYLQAKVDSAEAALNGADFRDFIKGYRRYYDAISFARLFLVNEVARNVDGYRISTFFHKDRDSKGGKIKAGPAWDYDLAFANADYCDGFRYDGWSYLFGKVCPGDGLQVPFHWKRMLEDPAFVSELHDEYSRMRKGPWKIENLHAYIDSLAATLQEAQQRNFQRWPVLGQYVWPNPRPVPTTWQGEVDELKRWLDARLQWLDWNIPGAILSIDPPQNSLTETTLEVVPNPFETEAHLRFKVPRDMEVFVEIFDVTGKLITTKIGRLEQSQAELQLPVMALRHLSVACQYPYRSAKNAHCEAVAALLCKSRHLSHR
ncbi:MAG: CotH kinase family protein [Spirosomataceae bacterium]